jgi:hypothetical protein
MSEHGGWQQSDQSHPTSPSGSEASVQQAAAATGGNAAPGWYAVPDGRTLWWDGTQWHDQAPTLPPQPLRPIDGVSVAVQVLLAIGVAISLAIIAVDAWRFTLVGRLGDGTFADPAWDDLGVADGLAGTLALVSILVFLPTVVVFLVWRHRVQANLQGALLVRGLEYTPGWAVGWWFVPIANLFKPKQAMNEAWLATDPEVPPGSTAWRTKAPAMLSWWWACWLLSTVFVNISDGSGDPADFRFSLIMWMVSESLTVAAAALIFVIVRQITERHQRRAQRLGLIAPS